MSKANAPDRSAGLLPPYFGEGRGRTPHPQLDIDMGLVILAGKNVQKIAAAIETDTPERRKLWATESALFHMRRAMSRQRLVLTRGQRYFVRKWLSKEEIARIESLVAQPALIPMHLPKRPPCRLPHPNEDDEEEVETPDRA